jgi:putative pyruvate formate lyase activating enzyme
MYRQVGKASFDGEGLIKRGIIVRHLVLPSHRKDSIAELERLAEILPVADVKLSLVSQYTPEFALDTEFKNLHRRVTSFEYSSVLDKAISLGFDGYFQECTSASESFTPSFECGDMLAEV